MNLAPRHSLLKRQLRRSFGDSFPIPPEWQGFIEAVDEAYREFDLDREMLERSLELRSQELVQANSEMRAVFQAIPDLLLRLDGGGRILNYEAGVSQDLFLEPKELFGKRIQDIPLKQLGTQFDEAIRQVQETASMTSIEYALTVQGQERFYEARLVPLLENQIVVLIRNITERKRAEAEREALIAALEAKNEELERFTYTVSHDLKSPLITIQGFVGFLEQDALAGNITQLRADVDRISKATHRMGQLLNELLELSRIGRIANPPEVVPFAELVHEAASLVAGQLSAHSVQLDIASDLPVVYGDRARLREVIQNLLDNAIKYMGEQRHPRVEIGARTEQDETILYVRDNGMGIEPRYQQKIFGLFEQLDTKNEGTGIGLAIVKRIVEVHGGRIWVESEGTGRGSTFCFTLSDKPC